MNKLLFQEVFQEVLSRKRTTKVKLTAVADCQRLQQYVLALVETEAAQLPHHPGVQEMVVGDPALSDHDCRVPGETRDLCAVPSGLTVHADFRRHEKCPFVICTPSSATPRTSFS